MIQLEYPMTDMSWTLEHEQEMEQLMRLVDPAADSLHVDLDTLPNINWTAEGIPVF